MPPLVASSLVVAEVMAVEAGWREEAEEVEGAACLDPALLAAGMGVGVSWVMVAAAVESCCCCCRRRARSFFRMLLLLPSGILVLGMVAAAVVMGVGGSSASPSRRESDVENLRWWRWACGCVSF